MDTLNNLTISAMMKHSNYIVRDHRVHGVRIMPGVTMLDIIYRFLISRKVDTSKIELREVTFLEPVSTTEEYDRKISISFEKEGEHYKISVQSQKVKGNEILDSHWNDILKCELHWISSLPERKKIDIEQIKNESNRIEDMDYAYSYVRKIDISHREFMKGNGRLYFHQNRILAEITLSDLAAKFLDHYYMHPAYLDAATLVQGFVVLQSVDFTEEVQASIPIYIKSFCSTEAMGDKIYVYIKNEGYGHNSIRDIVYFNIEVYNEKGEEIALFQKWGLKKIRYKELVEKVQPNLAKQERETFVKDQKKELDDEKEEDFSRMNEDGQEAIKKYLRKIVGEFLQIEISSSMDMQGFYDCGLNSQDIMKIVTILEEKKQISLYPTLLFEYANIEELSQYLYEEHRESFFKHTKPLQEEEILSEGTYLYRVIEKECDSITLAEKTFQAGLIIVSPAVDILSMLGQVSCKRWYFVYYSEEYRNEGNNYYLDLMKPEHIQQLMIGLASNQINIELVLHELQIRESNSYEDCSSVIKEVFCVTKALLNQKTKIQTRYLALLPGQLFEAEMAAALGNFFQCVGGENPKLLATAVVIKEKMQKKMEKNICQEIGMMTVPLVFWKHGKRIKQSWEKQARKKAKESFVTKDANYLITGGAGGLGIHLTKHIIKRGGNVILLGRSEQNKCLHQFSQKMQERIFYIPCDVTSKNSLTQAAQKLQNENKKLEGIFHLAGITKDGYLVSKEWEDFQSVYRVKAQGAMLLDEIFAKEKLKFFVCFSSIAGILGNPAQSDYAVGNAFMDGFMDRRNKAVESGKRYGRNFSINWPMWKDGGMHGTSETLHTMKKKFGMSLLRPSDGMEILEEILFINLSQVLVVSGDEEKLDRVFTDQKSIPKKEETPIKMVQKDEVAIIGLSGRFPMAENVTEFWENLVSGKDCITQVPKDRWDTKKFEEITLKHWKKTMPKWGGFLKNYNSFDPVFFNISPAQAALMDPQERMFLEVAWECFEDGGYKKSEIKNSQIGVFVGAMWMQYQMNNTESEVSTSIISSIANRVSYYFGLKGPSMAVDTMCSSTLTALHLACQSILSGDCKMALVGGTNISAHPDKYRLLAQGNFTSADGRCKAFSREGDGYVPSEAVGGILLKSFRQAKKDQDRIYGVIKASSLNHNGDSGGFTVPSPKAQEEAIRNTIEKSGVKAEKISYIEAHGTGTSLGDPIEINALKKAFSLHTDKKQFCGVGSVKSNIGHAESAAGIVSIIKVLLQMKYNLLVPTIHWEPVNANITWDDSPFYIQKDLKHWEEEHKVAAISAFGAGGSNAHVILEKYDEPSESYEEDAQPTLCMISAHKETTLMDYAKNLLYFLQDDVKVRNGSRMEVERNLQRGLKEELQLDMEQISAADYFEDLNLDEKQKIGFCEMIQKYYRKPVTPAKLDSLESVGNLVKYLLEKETFAEVREESFSLTDIAYTLSKREFLTYRLAIVASSKTELATKLQAYQNKQETDGTYIGGWGDSPLSPQPDCLIKQLAIDWVSGKSIDLELLFAGRKKRLISLPHYPFTRRICKMGQESPESKESRESESVSNSWQPEIPNIYDQDDVGFQIIDGLIAVVTIQDKKGSNTFTETVIQGLMYYFEQIRKNPQIKAVIVTGNDKIFCMGGTKEQLKDISDEKLEFTDAPFLYTGLLKCEVPVISAMQGHASGGGMLFGLYADIVIMSLESVYSAVFTKYGFTPGMGATFILEDKLGKNLAYEMMFSAKTYTGRDLQNRNASVIFKPQEEVLKEAVNMARLIVQKPKNTLRVLKEELSGRILERLLTCIEKENDMHKKTFTNNEVKERISQYYISDDRDRKKEIKEEDPIINSLVESIERDDINLDELAQFLEVYNE